MRCADARVWLVAALAACLLACTGPGLEPPSKDDGDFSPGSQGAPSGTGGSRSDDAGAEVGAGDEDDPPQVVVDDGGVTPPVDAGDAGDGGDPDLDAGTP